MTELRKFLLIALLLFGLLLWARSCRQPAPPPQPPVPSPAPAPSPTPQPEPVPSIPLDDAAKGLIEAGKAYKGAHVCESELHPLLQQLAVEHANYQARTGVQGHQNWNSRASKIMKLPGISSAAEIVAESWKEQQNDSTLSLGREMFYCWERSPGHWSVASKKHKYFGAAMAQCEDGRWMSCICVGD